MRRRWRGESGFSLVESVVACGVVTVGVLSVAQLFAMAVSMNAASRNATLAAILAAQKVEELRTVAEPAGGVEFIDARGRPLPYAGGVQPPGAAFLRRWAIEPLHVDPSNVAALAVTVTPVARGVGAREVALASVWRRR